jgi:nucleoside-diphosphate-sugar epimerase
LVSAQPGEDGDPALACLSGQLAAAPDLRWIGYLSTIGVYGNHDGAWIDETAECRPTNARSTLRLTTDKAWLAFGEKTGKPVQIFRLAGIYGPGRNGIVNLRAGTARRLVKPGQVFNRIHAQDIAGVLLASLEKPRNGAVYNVTDDEPAPPQDVVSFAAGLIGLEPPPEIPFDPARLTPMAASFYGENKRVSNALMKRELGYTLRYPTYREALRALAEAGE